MAKYVNRTEVLRRVQHYAMLKSKTPGQAVLSMDEVASIVLDVPAADVVEVKHGTNDTDMNPSDEFICSECGLIMRDCCRYEIDENDGDEICYEFPFGFCPRCGAKMDGERREDDERQNIS